MVSVKNMDIYLLKWILTNFTNQILSVFWTIKYFLVDDKFFQEARDTHNLLKDQQAETKTFLITTVSELEELKEGGMCRVVQHMTKKIRIMTRMIVKMGKKTKVWIRVI